MRSLILILSITCCVVGEAFGQSLWAGGGMVIDVQRFPQDATPNRLDGKALGWTAFGGTTLWDRVVVGVEWVDAGTIGDVRQTSLDVNGRRVSITSTFQHRTRGLAVWGGYRHALRQVQFAYLLGAQMIDIERRFSSDASSLVLMSPSRTTANPVSILRDRFVVPAGGVNAFIRTSEHLALGGGLRIHRLPLDTDFFGWNVRTVAGATWLF